MHPGKEFPGCGQVTGLIAEPGEYATGHRSAPTLDQQIGISPRRQPIAEREIGTVGHIGIKDVADRNHAGLPGPGSKYACGIKIAYAIAKAHLNAGGAGLIQQGSVQRTVSPSTADQIKKWSHTAHRIPSSGRIEDCPAVKGVMFEIRRDAGAAQLIQRISSARPVLQSLEIFVKAMPDIGMPFAHRHVAPRLCQHNGAGQSGRSGADNGDVGFLHHVTHLCLSRHHGRLMTTATTAHRKIWPHYRSERPSTSYRKSISSRFPYENVPFRTFMHRA